LKKLIDAIGAIGETSADNTAMMRPHDTRTHLFCAVWVPVDGIRKGFANTTWSRESDVGTVVEALLTLFVVLGLNRQRRFTRAVGVVVLVSPESLNVDHHARYCQDQKCASPSACIVHSRAPVKPRQVYAQMKTK